MSTNLIINTTAASIDQMVCVTFWIIEFKLMVFFEKMHNIQTKEWRRHTRMDHVQNRSISNQIIIYICVWYVSINQSIICYLLTLFLFFFLSISHGSWQCSALYTTIFHNQTNTKYWRFFSICLFDIVDCKYTSYNVLVCVLYCFLII